MKPIKIFIVEDDPMYAKVLAYHLSQNPDYEIEKYESGKDCLENLYKTPILLRWIIPCQILQAWKF
jgi:DNA-binding response OmpR family regulator